MPFAWINQLEYRAVYIEVVNLKKLALRFKFYIFVQFDCIIDNM